MLQVHGFFGYLEAVLASRPSITGHFVGDRWTLADCALLNWPNTFSSVVALDIAKRYPKVWANFEKVKELRPKGSENHLDIFGNFGAGCVGANKEAAAGGHSIENLALWPN
jgi:hypothetical protein